MTRVVLHPDALMKVIAHVSTDDRRPTLHGVMLKAGGVAVASNGATLGAHRFAHESTSDLLVCFPKMSRRLFRKASKLQNEVMLDLDDCTIMCAGSYDIFKVEIFTGDDISYPDYTHVLPGAEKLTRMGKLGRTYIMALR